MLDANTKRNIDAARNVLVGKVPDPKAQVEQITTALIYKFMDDLDKEAVELGGKAKFFTGDYEKYTWTKVLDTRLSGEARLDLYVQAISNMSKNPNLPQLFRDIFKGAFLPYNDSQTLSLFLKEINNFTYSHSEELGNAFEYLLSVLGSQGDAGQFRTPRHIIDFIVGVVDPQKTDTILDPACGTAGFLISAYKHIRKHNSSNYQPDKETAIGESASEVILLEKEAYTGDKLTTAEREKLPQNIQGYDISPDMVKLSLVNLYLHGFATPNIYEYDTLTSEKRWNESFDVILANPPFMTPKGGIRPHKRFQVQANRSEVLFVDYILEHLNLKGRAGVIVPEGVIFKSENAYKRLRKLLVEDGLFAVVSLPQGVFNPYSGVKTSILFFDNEVAKLTDEILFVRIEYDGFDLGAQRRKIEKDDLPEARTILEAWKRGEKRKSDLALWVKKSRIEGNSYNLTGERYREKEIGKHQKWPSVKLGNICEIFNGSRPKGGAISDGVISIGGEHINSDGSFNLSNPKYIPESFFRDLKRGKLNIGDVLLVKDGATTGKVGYFDQKAPFKVGAINEHVFILRTDPDRIIPYYLYQYLRSKKGNAEILKHKVGAAQGGINLSIKTIEIPLPPMEVQRELVKQIEVKQSAIEAAKAVIKNLERERRYFGQELGRLERVEWVKLGDLFQKANESIDPRQQQGAMEYVGLQNIESNTGRLVGETKAKVNSIKSAKTRFKEGDILYGKLRPNLNKVWVADRNGICSTDIYVLRKKSEAAESKLYAKFFRSDLFNAEVLSGLRGAQLPRVSFEYLASLRVPVLSSSVKSSLLADLEIEESALEANMLLVQNMEKRIARVLDVI